MKICTKCNEEKPFSEFTWKKWGKNNPSFCHDCYKSDQKRRYRENRKYYIAKSKAYRQSAHGQKTISKQKKEYRQTERGHNLHSKHLKRYGKKYPEKIIARVVVYQAIKKGKIPKVSDLVCEGCGCRAQHYHHDSYKKEDRLRITALCKSCHTKVHNR